MSSRTGSGYLARKLEASREALSSAIDKHEDDVAGVLSGVFDLVRKNSDFYEIEQCVRCHRDLHSACYWRQLPIEEWLHYIRWMEEQSDEEFQAGIPFDRKTVCAACRQGA